MWSQGPLNIDVCVSATGPPFQQSSLLKRTKGRTHCNIRANRLQLLQKKTFLTISRNDTPDSCAEGMATLQNIRIPFALLCYLLRAVGT